MPPKHPRPLRGFENVEGGFLDDLPKLIASLKSFNPKSEIENPNPEDEPPPGWEDQPDWTPDDPDREPEPELVRLSEWGDRPIEWLWGGMIPLRKVTLLVGDPEQGKTFFALDLAARLSRGLAIPPDAPTYEPASVMILSADDELDDTLIPRLQEAGADLGHIYSLTNDGPRSAGLARPQISLAQDVAALEAAMRRVGNYRLIIVDPVTAKVVGSG